MRKILITCVVALSFTLGCAVMLGYALKSALLVQVIPGTVPMACNAALSFILSSIAMIALMYGSRKLTSFATACAGTFPLLTLHEYLNNSNLKIDELFFDNFLVVETMHPGRMAPQTALCFLLVSSGLLIANTAKQNWKNNIFATLLGMTVTLVGSLGILGYVFDVQSLYGWGYFPRMAIHTTVGFILLGLSLVFYSFRVGSSNEERLGVIRYQLLCYSIAGTLFVGLFSSNAGLLPSFSQLERSTRFKIEANTDSESILISSWLTNVKEVLNQLSSRTFVRRNFEAYERGTSSMLELQQIVTPDLGEGLAATSGVSGVCRTKNEGCIFSVGEHIPEEIVASSLGEEQFISGPFLIGENLKFIAKHQVMTITGDVKIFDLYIVDADWIVTAVAGDVDLKLSEKSYLAVDQGKTWNFYEADPARRKLSQINSVDQNFSELLSLASANTSGTFQTDSSIRHGALMGFSRVAGLPWVVINSVDPDIIYSGASSWVTTAFALVGAIVIFGSLGMYLLLQPLQHQMFVHSNSLEEKVRQKTQELQRATEFKTQFLANMSHEIRTPLTGIIGYSESLLSDELSRDEQKLALEIVNKNGTHLLGVINDILDLSKIESGKLDVEVVPTSLPDLISDVANLMQLKAAEKGISLGFNYTFPIPNTIRTDPIRLKQILINLVGNAVKFTSVGGVKINVSYKDDVCSFAVIDTGVGLSEEQGQKLFKAFAQADTSITRKFGGTGLGLVISAQLAKKLGGEITMTSEIGKGSVFTLFISVGKVGDSDLLFSEEKSFPHALPATANEVPILRGRVLVAEDGEDNQKLISFLLQKTGLTFEMVSNGELAVNRVKNERFDLILLDMQMPVMDGYTAAKIIRDQGIETPIISLSANAMKADIERASLAGCSDFLGKPFTRIQLFSILQKYFDASKITSNLSPVINVSEDFRHTISIVKEDPEILELIVQIIEKLPMRQAEVSRAYENNDWEDLALLAHSLRGAVGNIGLTTLGEVLQEIESAAKSRSKNEISSAIPRLKSLFDEVKKLPEILKDVVRTS